MPAALPTSPRERIAMSDLAAELLAFKDFGEKTLESSLPINGHKVPVFTNEFWTAKQRAAHSLHEVSYRACFKPQLPRFFIERLTSEGDSVYDPFMGRGTTLLESALLKRSPLGCDVNPLSATLIAPRLHPPSLAQVAERLQHVDFSLRTAQPDDLLTFYHPDTLRQIGALRHHLAVRQSDGDFDRVDAWIRMVALNRLTGHSAGFFSVYTLPPNQAVSVTSQQRINERLQQTPPIRDVPALILKKTRQLLKNAHQLACRAKLLTRTSDHTPEIPDSSVDLVVTSPPFLNVVDYAADNWLRCWFLGIDATTVPITVPRKLNEWQTVMSATFCELHRVLRPGGCIAFEVGEINGGKLRLEEAAIPCGIAAGLKQVLVLINAQAFTKTANCWGVSNNSLGTNTNRVVLFEKP